MILSRTISSSQPSWMRPATSQAPTTERPQLHTVPSPTPGSGNDTVTFTVPGAGVLIIIIWIFWCWRRGTCCFRPKVKAVALPPVAMTPSVTVVQQTTTAPAAQPAPAPTNNYFIMPNQMSGQCQPQQGQQPTQMGQPPPYMPNQPPYMPGQQTYSPHAPGYSPAGQYSPQQGDAPPQQSQFNPMHPGSVPKF